MSAWGGGWPGQPADWATGWPWGAEKGTPAATPYKVAGVGPANPRRYAWQSSEPGGIGYTAPPVYPPAAPPDPGDPTQFAGGNPQQTGALTGTAWLGTNWYGLPDQSYRQFSDLATKNYYEEHPSEGWQQYVNWGLGERDTNLRQFALSRYQQSLADYDLLNESRPNAMYVDTMTPQLMDHIRTLFYDQNASAKGYVNAWMPQGRLG